MKLMFLILLTLSTGSFALSNWAVNSTGTAYTNKAFCEATEKAPCFDVTAEKAAHREAWMLAERQEKEAEKIALEAMRLKLDVIKVKIKAKVKLSDDELSDVLTFLLMKQGEKL